MKLGGSAFDDYFGGPYGNFGSFGQDRKESGLADWTAIETFEGGWRPKKRQSMLSLPWTCVCFGEISEAKIPAKNVLALKQMGFRLPTCYRRRRMCWGNLLTYSSTVSTTATVMVQMLYCFVGIEAVHRGSILSSLIQGCWKPSAKPVGNPSWDSWGSNCIGNR